MNLQRLVFLCAALTSSLALLGQYPSNLHNSELRVWLKTNEYNNQFADLGYNGARQQMYSFTDEVNGKIQCVYTDFEMDAEFTTFPDPINAEHLVPQSFFGSTSPMRSDLYNLRPSHQDANSARAFYDFGEVTDSQAQWYGVTSNNNYTSSATQPANSDNYSEGIEFLWEPQEDRKGDIARGLFYFYTMYPTQAGPITDLVDINLMYEWHLADPVDALEIQRNNRVEQVQGNRNPYVDFEELVYDAWLWVEMLGCTDPEANNFNAEANTDDGSCVYGVSGCTDPLYLEFNPEATVEDGSCLTLIILGCKYPMALNYNPNANKDDNGSCEFESVGCLGDFNGDSAVTIGDLSGFLASYGSNCSQ